MSTDFGFNQKDYCPDFPNHLNLEHHIFKARCNGYFSIRKGEDIALCPSPCPLVPARIPNVFGHARGHGHQPKGLGTGRGLRFMRSHVCDVWSIRKVLKTRHVGQGREACPTRPVLSNRVQLLLSGEQGEISIREGDKQGAIGQHGDSRGPFV